MTCDGYVIINQLVASVAQIEEELGVSPEGVYPTVRTRLDIVESRINNPLAPAPNVLNPFSISGTGTTIQTGFGDPNVTLALQPDGYGSLFLREDGTPTQGLYSYGTDGTWHNVGSGGGTDFNAAGDLSGSADSQTVVGIQNHAVSATPPTTGQVLEYNGSVWIPTTIVTGSFTAGGDLSGTSTSQTVIGIEGKILPALSAGYLNYTGTAFAYTALPSSLPPSGTAGGDLSGTYPNPTVGKINGTTVPTGTGNAIGNGLYITTAGSPGVTAYSALNLAGGTNFVTGVLPIGNQASQTMAGDVTGTTAASTVARLQGTITLSGTPSTGQVLTATSATAADWQTPGTVTSVTMGGDVTGNSATSTVVKVDGVSYPASPSTNTVPVVTASNTVTYQAIANAQVSASAAIAYSKLNLTGDVVNADISASAAIVYSKLSLSNSILNADINSAAAIAYSKLNLTGDVVNADIATAAAIAVTKLAAGTSAQILLNNSTPTPTWTTVTGDVTISNTGATTVGKLQGTITLSGTPSTGQVLTATSATAANWQTPGTVTSVTMGGDVTGNSATSTVAKINGTTVPVGTGNAIGNGLYITTAGATGTLAYSALNLAGGANFVTGVLPTGNQASQTMAGDVTGTTAASTVAKINGTSVPATPTANQVLIASSGTSSTWALIANANVSATAAITYSKLNLTGNIVNADISSSAAIAYSKLNLTGDVVNADISSSAAIAVSKLAAGTAGQVLLNDSTPTPTYTTLGQDAVVDSAGDVTVEGIRTKSLAASLASIGATQDGYVLTWVNGNDDWEAVPPSGGGGGPTGIAGGDLGGTYPDPLVVALQGNHVSNAAPTDGYVLTWVASDSAWEPVISTSAGGTTPTGPAGGDLSGTYPNPLVATSGGNTIITDVTAAGGDLSGTYPNPSVATSGGNTIITNVTSITSGDLSGNYPNPTVVSSGGNTIITVATSAAGDLTGTYPAPAVAKLQGFPVSVSSPGDGQVLTWIGIDSQWEPITPPASLPPSGTASGDLGGNYPNPSVVALQSQPVSASVPGAGQLLGFDGTTWAAQTLGGDVILTDGYFNQTFVQDLQGLTLSASGANAPVNGSFLTYDGSQWIPNVLTGGDVTGGWNAATVVALQNVPVQASGTPTDGFVLTYVAADSQWEPVAPPSGSFTAGGDLTGTSSSQQVISITGASGVVNIASTGNVLTWDPTTAAPGLTQGDNTTASSTGAILKIQAQNATGGGGSSGGDLVLSSGTGDDAALAGAVRLQSGGTDVAFTVPADSSTTPGAKFVTNGRRRAANPQTGDYTIEDTDDIIAMGTNTDAKTITMPASPQAGDAYDIKDTTGDAAAHPITVNGNGNNIDGASTYTISLAYGSVTLVYTGPDWSIL